MRLGGIFIQEMTRLERKEKGSNLSQPIPNPKRATGSCVKKQKRCQCLWRAAPARTGSRPRPSKCRFRHFCRLIIAALDLVVYP